MTKTRLLAIAGCLLALRTCAVSANLQDGLVACYLFEGGEKFDGNRHNDCHYTNKAKQAAHDAAKGDTTRR